MVLRVQAAERGGHNGVGHGDPRRELRVERSEVVLCDLDDLNPRVDGCHIVERTQHRCGREGAAGVLEGGPEMMAGGESWITDVLAARGDIEKTLMRTVRREV